MTLEEAKKILESEGFELLKTDKLGSGTVSEAFTEYENPEICEAMQTVYCAGYKICMFSWRFDERKARLKEEYEKNTKAPGPGEEQPEEKKGIIYPSTFPKADFYYKHVLNEGNPALKESATQFNDALLDEQAKKIKRLGKEIAKLNGIIHDKNEEIKRKTKGCCELVTENVDLEKKLSDKDAVLSDVAEELRLSKIREKNLTELCQKYIKANEELKEELADKVVDKIDAQALKSAESALTWKEKVICYKDMAIAYNEKEIAEKDEVISDLGKELAATKKQLEEKTKLVESSKEYCDYGVAANEFIKELAGLYILASNTGIIKDEMLERCKNYQTYGFPANCNRETKKEIGDIASGKTKAVGVDIAGEGADQSGKIVICGKDFGKILKENKEAAEELFKVLDDVIEFMSVESKQLFEGDGIPTKIEVVKPSRKLKTIL